MKRERGMLASLFMWATVAGFLFQNLVIPVMSIRFEDQKHYYSPPDPHSGSPPTGSHKSPPHGKTPPSHGTPTPPSHGTYNPTPSPPSNCGNPPNEPSTPSTPSNPPSDGGGYNSPPTYGGGSPPSDGGGYNSPPTYGGGSPPSDGGGYNSPPTYGGGSPPDIVTPSPPDTITPSPPSITPGTPTIPTPPFDPNSPVPGTCTYWSSHPGLIWGLLGWWGTLGGIGVPSVPGFGSSTSLLQALSNTHTDGFGALYREGTASWLNSMASHRFPFTTNQVRNSFVAALHSDKAAAAQARLFKLANEGHLKPRV
ncbi:hypothetical protein AB3S75_037712 [Citrus x aurantiifolia]